MDSVQEDIVRALVHDAPVAMFVKTAALQYRFANPAMLRLADRGFAELVGRSVFDVFPDHATALSELEFDVLATGRPRTREVVLDTPGLGERTYEDAVFRVDIDGEECIGVVRIDVTEAVRLRAERDRYDRLASIGRLASGVVDEIGDALEIIRRTAEALGGGASPDEIDEARARILEAAAAAADFGAGLQEFVRPAPETARPTDVNATLSAQIDLLRRTIDPGIGLRTVLAPDLPEVRIESHKLAQILTNLCLNAAHAIERTDRRGEILVETRRVAADEAVALVPSGVELRRPDTDHVLLAVRDDGCGMDADTIAHAFEPFYTTRRDGGGTGLGLSLVFGVVRQLDGTVFLRSEVGRGTEVSMLLPVDAD